MIVPAMPRMLFANLMVPTWMVLVFKLSLPKREEPVTVSLFSGATKSASTVVEWDIGRATARRAIGVTSAIAATSAVTASVTVGRNRPVAVPRTAAAAIAVITVAAGVGIEVDAVDVALALVLIHVTAAAVVAGLALALTAGTARRSQVVVPDPNRALVLVAAAAGVAARARAAVAAVHARVPVAATAAVAAWTRRKSGARAAAAVAAWTRRSGARVAAALVPVHPTRRTVVKAMWPWMKRRGMTRRMTMCRRSRLSQVVPMAPTVRGGQTAKMRSSVDNETTVLLCTHQSSYEYHSRSVAIS